MYSIDDLFSSDFSGLSSSNTVKANRQFNIPTQYHVSILTSVTACSCSSLVAVTKQEEERGQEGNGGAPCSAAPERYSKLLYAY